MYPSVLSESDTLDAVLAGRSLARYGDGEFTLAEGRSIVNQPRSPELCRRMRDILLEDGPCLVGIPNIRSPTPKAPFWAKYHRVAPLLNPQMVYGSSFVSRPDSAPWVDTPAYWAKLDQIWAGQDVTLIRGTTPAQHPKKPIGKLVGAVSLLPADLATATSVTEIIAPSVDAWSGYADLLERIGTPTKAIICLGATATVLAVDLCRRGVHAIDLGHVGIFLRRARQQPPVVSC